MKLEIKKLQAELARVIAARLEQDYIIEQRLDEIERLKKNIEIQSAREIELSKKLMEIKGE